MALYKIITRIKYDTCLWFGLLVQPTTIVVDPTKNICKQTIIDLVNCACTFVV